MRPDGAASLLQQVLNQILVAQATEQIGAERHERTPERQGYRRYRNGSRERVLQTRVGKITLSVPRFRDGEFSTELFARYQRSEQAFVLAMMEMVIQGVSTRKVTAITEELCGASFSKSTVSQLCRELDPTLDAWRNRPLSGDQYPFVLVDGLVIRVREGRQVHQRSALIAVGVSLSTGRREVLGLQIGDGESEASWSEFFLHLKERGLTGVDLVVSDQHKGLVNAVYKHFQGAVWQRCQVHFQRNIRDACPKKEWEESVHGQVRQILESPDEATARERLEGAPSPDARRRSRFGCSGAREAGAGNDLPGGGL